MCKNTNGDIEKKSCDNLNVCTALLTAIGFYDKRLFLEG
jgi:hypothetical protein